MTTKKQVRNTNKGDRVQVQYDIDPAVHGVRFYFQVSDDNSYYQDLIEKVADYDSANPMDAGQFSADWLPSDKRLKVGAFSSKTGWYYDSKPIYDVHIGLYDDITAGSEGKPSIPAKMKLVIEPRMDGMYKNTGSNSWHAGTDGDTHYGTNIRIQCSFPEDPQTAVNRANSFIGLVLDRRVDLSKDIIRNTHRFCNPETYVRINDQYSESMIEELRSSAKLVAQTGSGREEGNIKRGEYEIYRFKTDNFEELGFTNGAADDATESIKIYQHRNASQMPPDNPAYHPKVESSINDSYHISQWANVIRRLKRIVLAHAHWSGITDSGFVADDYFGTGQGITITLPDGKKEKLQQYYNSAEMERTISGCLFHQDTKSDRDILTVLLHGNEHAHLSYDQLVEKTGLAKPTVRKRIRKLVKDDILKKYTSAKTFVAFNSDIIKRMTKSLLTKTKTIKGYMKEVRQRRTERKNRRES